MRRVGRRWIRERWNIERLTGGVSFRSASARGARLHTLHAFRVVAIFSLLLSHALHRNFARVTHMPYVLYSKIGVCRLQELWSPPHTSRSTLLLRSSRGAKLLVSSSAGCSLPLAFRLLPSLHNLLLGASSPMQPNYLFKVGGFRRCLTPALGCYRERLLNDRISWWLPMWRCAI